MSERDGQLHLFAMQLHTSLFATGDFFDLKDPVHHRLRTLDKRVRLREKTTLANWIRANSGFCKPELNNNWASVPCGQYTTETMRSELFGYVKGAFIGAEKDHDGLLKTADGDTLFLDEVGDISGDLQRLLIRAVEEGTDFPLLKTSF